METNTIYLQPMDRRLLHEYYRGFVGFHTR